MAARRKVRMIGLGRDAGRALWSLGKVAGASIALAHLN